MQLKIFGFFAECNTLFELKMKFVIVFFSFAAIIHTYAIANNGLTFDKDDNSSTICSQETFDGDENAVRACKAAFALQHNWYPSPIAGLFSYQTWNGFDGFWQNGAVLETLANFMYYGNNTMYKSVVKGSIREVYSLLEAYYPQPSFDDMGWYGLSYARIHEILGNESSDQYSNFLYQARQVFDWIWNKGWDTSGNCSGGIWFDQTEGSKQTVENAQMLLLGAKLYRLTSDKSLLEKTEAIWQFIEKNRLINQATYLVDDGIRPNCSNEHNYGPTYNMGLMIGALVEASKVLNQSNYLISLAHKIAMATITNATKNGILVEYCYPSCDDDAKMFKGIFMRNLRYLIDHTIAVRNPDEMKNLAKYYDFIQLNSDSAWVNNQCQPALENCTVVYKDGRSLHNTTVGPVFGIHFFGPFNYSAPMQQTSVLDLFVSGIKSNTKCHGIACSFDPPIPQPHPLTCQDNPCPVDQPCCEWQNEYYTCCESVQKCQNGECI